MLSLVRLVRNPSFPKVLCTTALRPISTSNKKDDTTNCVGAALETEHEKPKKKKFFYDYGFGGLNEEDEHNRLHSAFFMYITMAMVGTGFFIMYAPNPNMHDWALREAYLELRRREKLGLPLIDPNYVDPATVFLPSDEELGDTNIII